MTQTTDEAVERIIEIVEKSIRGTLLASSSRIIEATPVDTGLLRSNWQATISRPASGTIQSDGKAAAGRTASTQAMTETAKLQLGMNFYLTNNVQYAAWVENNSHMVKMEMTRLASKPLVIKI